MALFAFSGVLVDEVSEFAFCAITMLGKLLLKAFTAEFGLLFQYTFRFAAGARLQVRIKLASLADIRVRFFNIFCGSLYPRTDNR